MAWINFTDFAGNSATFPGDYLVGYIGVKEQRYPVVALKNGLSAGLFTAQNLLVTEDTTIRGNLSVLGASSVFETIVSVTSALSVINVGTGPALTVKQTGTEPIALFLDDDNNAFRIDDDFKVSFFNSHATNSYSIAENYNTRASGIASHAEGTSTVASGQTSHAEGQNSIASGYISHTQGFGTSATNTCAHAEGYLSVASGNTSHAEGDATVASGDGSHAEGTGTVASGAVSHAEGDNTQASGQASHAEGTQTIAQGTHSHAEGSYTICTGLASHAEGNYTRAFGDISHAEGDSSVVVGNYSHAEGEFCIVGSAVPYASYDFNNKVFSFTPSTSGYLGAVYAGMYLYGRDNDWSGDYWYIQVAARSTINGNITAVETPINGPSNDGFLYAPVEAAHAEGQNTNASGIGSHAEGGATNASGNYSHAEGYYANASGVFSHAEGQNTYAVGVGSHAEGAYNTAFGLYSHAEGGSVTDATLRNTASGTSSHAQGRGTLAYGTASHAEGILNQALGDGSHAQGLSSIASGDYSFAAGTNVLASGTRSTATGQWTSATKVTSYASGRWASADHSRSWVWHGTGLEGVTARFATTRADQFAICPDGGFLLSGAMGINTDSIANALTVNGVISTNNTIVTPFLSTDVAVINNLTNNNVNTFTLTSDNLITNTLTSRNISLVHTPANDGINPFIQLGEFTTGSTTASAFSGFRFEYNEVTNALGLSSIFSNSINDVLNIGSNGNLTTNSINARGALSASDSITANTGILNSLSASGGITGNTGVFGNTSIFGRLSVLSPNYNSLLARGVSALAADPIPSIINSRVGIETVPLTSYNLHIRGGNLRVDGVDYSNVPNITSFDTDGQSLFDLRSGFVGANYNLSIAESGLGNFMKFFGGRTGDEQPFIVTKAGSPLRFATFNSYYDGASFSEKVRIGGNGNLSVGLGTDGVEKVTVLGNISASGSVISNALTSRNIALIHTPADDGVNPYFKIGEYTSTSTTASAFSGFHLEYNEKTNLLNLSSMFGTTVTNVLTIDPFTSVTPYGVSFDPYVQTGTNSTVYPQSLSGVIPASELSTRLRNNKGTIEGVFYFAQDSSANAKWFIVEIAKNATFTSQNTQLYYRSTGETTVNSILRPIVGVFNNNRIIFSNANATQPWGTAGSLINYAYNAGDSIYYRVGFQFPTFATESMALSAGSIRVIP